ncbi:MAG TPA: hypothetical protein VFT91_04365 [Dehalococcoidia bacterium]|nr:hypothetical protein [Dehalococcoidia bacterium]
MAVQPKDQQPDTALQWAEQELRETKARLHKVEHELDQAMKQVFSLDGDLRRLAESLAASAAALAVLPGFKEDVRQLREQVNRAQDRQAGLASRAEEALRQREAESGRERQERGALSSQVDGLARDLGQYEGRIQVLEEGVRHVEEAVAGAKLAQQALLRDLEEASSRAARGLDATVRLEHDLQRTLEEMQSLHKQDEALGDRLKLVQEQLRRQGEFLDKLEVLTSLPQEVKELLQRERFEREQMSERLTATEKASGQVADHVHEFVQGLARLEQRGQAHASQLLEMAEQMRELTEATQGKLKRLFQVMLRQRRRQLEALAQEIKELSHGEPQGGE